MQPKPRARRFTFCTDSATDKRHFLFRYPAKFHAPVARELIHRFTTQGDIVLDPFCGSGTLLLEAQTMGRSAVGVDIDPLAAFISTVKTSHWDHKALESIANRLLDRLSSHTRSDDEYAMLAHNDVDSNEVARCVAAEGLWIPEIPNIAHWFRKYVLIDMARILATLESRAVSSTSRPFFMLCFASIIRACSNADPVPVSGLEVTSHMRQKDAEGRVVNPFALFAKAVRKAITATAEAPAVGAGVQCVIHHGDATLLSEIIAPGPSVCITSPPYHGAVDYYRRHTLEMYWLRLVDSHEERLELRPRYIGQASVPMRHHALSQKIEHPTVNQWEKRIRKVNDKRANAFKHYVVSMQNTFTQLHAVLPPGGTAVLVVGKSSWNGSEIPTASLMSDLCEGKFDYCEQYWYPLKNRYMSYTRHNGADIDKEYVAVFKRKP
ncbi:TRM11 family SAM-dependent methyltransferase [Burkholderia gladioli]|uniref:TRM11 family SAM-dependent methyltransferase n=1 Tax=Burkholderia gladioli TaxID=28095 RepID=UPI0016401288|nr:DNA methyltransferase [Burkholderia gladioli]